MCFSATASFIASGALAATGVATLNKAKTNRELPLASIPMLFAVQQAIEGVVWISFGSIALNVFATYAYIFFSHVLWPALVPISILLVETDTSRLRGLRMCAFLGAAVGLYFLYTLVSHPVFAHVIGHSIAYTFPYFYPSVATFIYVVATCGSCFLSSHRILNVFGVILFVAFLVSRGFFFSTLLSVWCFFAALLSVVIYAHLASRGRPRAWVWLETRNGI